MKKLIIFVLGILLAVSVQANNSFQPGRVTKIILHDWGRVLIYLSGGIQTNEPCERKGAIVLDRANQHFAEMYAALLAAYHSGSEVGGWVNGCDSRHQAPILTRLDLMPK
jgi:hypothetical protein